MVYFFFIYLFIYLFIFFFFFFFFFLYIGTKLFFWHGCILDSICCAFPVHTCLGLFFDLGLRPFTWCICASRMLSLMVFFLFIDFLFQILCQISLFCNFVFLIIVFCAAVANSGMQSSIIQLLICHFQYYTYMIIIITVTSYIVFTFCISHLLGEWYLYIHPACICLILVIFFPIF